MAKATVFNPTTKERKAVEVGDPNAFAGGFILETPTNNLQTYKAPVVAPIASISNPVVPTSPVASAPTAPVVPATPASIAPATAIPAGATKISGPSGLEGLAENQIYRDPNSKDIYKLAGATPVASASTPPAGATKITGPSGLKGLNESQIWRDPNSKDIYKLPIVPAGETTPAGEIPTTGEITATSVMDYLGIPDLPSESEVISQVLESPEYKFLQDTLDTKGLSAEASAASAKDFLESKYAEDKTTLENNLASKGLAFSGIRGTAVATLASNLTASKLDIDRQLASKLLDFDLDLRNNVLDMVGDIVEEAKDNRSEAIDALKAVGYVVVGNKLMPTLEAQKLQQESEKAAKPITATVGKTLYQYDEATKTWKSIVSEPVEPNIIKINGIDYEVNPDGSLTIPKVPAANKEATDLQKQAGESAQALLDKFNQGVGTQIVGKSRIFTFGKAIPGTKAADFEIQFNNLKSLLSLDNVKLLKGQGQVSDAERKLLADASAKLSLNQSEPEFKRALQDVSVVLGLPGGLEKKDDGTYIYKNLDGTVHKGRQGDNYIDKTLPTDLDLTGTTSINYNTNSNPVTKIISTVPDGFKAGQCGRFVNSVCGLGVGDTYQSKMAKMDDSITAPEPGMIFTMPYKNTGHIGFILALDGDQAIVKDSNWYIDTAPETVATHTIPIAQMTGFRKV